MMVLALTHLNLVTCEQCVKTAQHQEDLVEFEIGFDCNFETWANARRGKVKYT